MARGWESKAVESQIDSAEEDDRQPHQEVSSEQAELLRKKEGLLLSRARVLHDLESARNARYRKQLNEALAHLNRELAQLS